MERNEPGPELTQARDAIIAEIRRRRGDRDTPFVVALDGGSGSGKSTLASLIAAEIQAVVIPGDDFYAAEISDTEWDSRAPEARAADAIDWRRLRAEAIEPLRAGLPARWHAFDFMSGARPDGTYAMGSDVMERQPAPVIILDGAYSTRPELADLIDLSVLLDVPVEVRHKRLRAREEKAFLDSWHMRWDAAEAYYFTQIRPPSAFDLVVTMGEIL